MEVIEVTPDEFQHLEFPMEPGRTVIKETGAAFLVYATQARTESTLEGTARVFAKQPFQSWFDAQPFPGGGLIIAGIPQGGYRLTPPRDVSGPLSPDSWAVSPVPSIRHDHTAVWTGAEMIVWGGLSDEEVPLATGGRYDPASDTWMVTNSANAPAARFGHSAVWTGREMVICGGQDKYVMLVSGSRYDPGADTWTAMSMLNGPGRRTGSSAVWTGSEVIIWGGRYLNALANGKRYMPERDEWLDMASATGVAARYNNTAVWTGSEMIVWGGYSTQLADYLDSGGRYSPAQDKWSQVASIGAPEKRAGHGAVWSGTEMIVWGGYNDGFQGFDYLATGGRYDPATDVWLPAETTGAPQGRERSTTLWTGTEMLVWGGLTFIFGTGNSYFSDGGLYSPSLDDDGNPATPAWRGVSQSNVPIARGRHTAVWTGDEMIVWGGRGATGFISEQDFNTGGRFNPVLQSWTPTSLSDEPTGRLEHSAVWTGSEMIVWGGQFPRGVALSSGGQYTPATDGWAPIWAPPSIEPRYRHTAVWTGAFMIVFGGYACPSSPTCTYYASAFQYHPSGSWQSLTAASSPRALHTAVWTGTEMLVWGGMNDDDRSGAGERYAPGTGIWTGMSSAGAPSRRDYHTAVWTGSEMIVWGGKGNGGLDVNTGGRYDPDLDLWTATSILGSCPLARWEHSAVWTGDDPVGRDKRIHFAIEYRRPLRPVGGHLDRNPHGQRARPPEQSRRGLDRHGDARLGRARG